MDIQKEIWEILETCKSARADVNKLSCVCTKGKGTTRKSRRFCNKCQAIAKFRSMRSKLEAIKKELRRTIGNDI